MTSRELEPSAAAPRRLRLAAKLTLAAAVALGAGELALRLRPGLLPGWYRERFPMHGVELYHPGILAATPITGLPLPIVVEPHVGPPPQDLKELGLVPPDFDGDARRYPEIRLPSDSLGLPNPERLARADLLLVGDSFGVAAGVERPPGLRARLAERTGRTVYDLSVSAIGPVREAWLLDEVGFALEPRAVVWLFYSGNDATLSIEPLIHEHRGASTWAEAYPDRRPPALRLVDLGLAWWRRSPPDAEAASGRRTRGFAFPLGDGGRTPLWFHPDNLRQLATPAEAWDADLGWRHAQTVLREVAERCAARGVRLLVVYVPSKPEVYLPWVEPDAEQALRTANLLWPEPLADDAETFLAAALAHRGALEQRFLAFCAEAGIACLSAVPHLEELARTGRLGYLAADTHWQEAGQAALLEPLVAALGELGVLE